MRPGFVTRMGAGGSPPAATMLADWDFSMSGVADGVEISSLTDQSGNGKTATNGSAGARPTSKTGGNGINGLSVGSFDGGDNLVASLSLAGVAYTIYAVVKCATAAGVMYFLTTNNASGTDKFGYWGWATTTARKLGHFGDDHTVFGQTQTTNAELWVSQYKDPGAEIWVDATSRGASATDPVNDLASVTQLFLGGTIFTKWSGLIGQIVVYQGAHDTTTRNGIEAALKAKWGTP